MNSKPFEFLHFNNCRPQRIPFKNLSKWKCRNPNCASINKQISALCLKKGFWLCFCFFWANINRFSKNLLLITLVALSQNNSSTIAVWYTCKNTADDQMFPWFIFSVPVLHVKLSLSGWITSQCVSLHGSIQEKQTRIRIYTNTNLKTHQKSFWLPM